MSTDPLAYSQELTLPRRRGPAFGHAGPLREMEAAKEDASLLGRRTEAVLALAIVTPVIAAYGALAYGAHSALSSVL